MIVYVEQLVKVGVNEHGTAFVCCPFCIASQGVESWVIASGLSSHIRFTHPEERSSLMIQAAKTKTRRSKNVGG